MAKKIRCPCCGTGIDLPVKDISDIWDDEEMVEAVKKAIIASNIDFGIIYEKKVGGEYGQG